MTAADDTILKVFNLADDEPPTELGEPIDLEGEAFALSSD